MATNVSFFIARRYLFSWKKRNTINLITIISVIGIAVSTVALVILISAFNGIEKMIDRMYSEFDTDLTISSANSKSFLSSQLDLNKIKQLNEVKSLSRSIEELVILKNGDKWVNARLMGVDSSFLTMASLNKHLVHQKKISKANDFIIPGAGLLEKLQIAMDQENNYESIIFYAPKRKISIKPGQNPFYLQDAEVDAVMNYNRDVNSEIVLTSFDFASELLQYENEYNTVLIDVKENSQSEEVKNKIQEIVGSNFKVKTRYEKNELIFKTSQSEKIIVICILVFIFILASFNLIASLTMLFVEKKKNFITLLSIGLTKNKIFKIFFIEGLLISGIGLILGLFTGYFICFIQYFGGIVVLPGTPEPFPINPTALDAIFIIVLVLGLSIIFSYTTILFLIRNNFSSRFLTRKLD